MKNEIGKHVLRLFSCVFFVLLLNPLAHGDASGPGNGTDYVKILFADAQYDISRSLVAMTENDVAELDVDPQIKQWLLARSQGITRFELVRKYLRKMDLKFQNAPCSDRSGKTASICFFYDSNNGPYVLISLASNRMTTKDQAIAMLIHEAGHFTGEMDHLFLDKVGVQMAAAVKLPRVLIADAESTEIVPNIFLAKQQCEAGSSQQARILRKEALTSLLVQCSARQIKCNVERAELIYRGTPEFKPGGGFTMKVTCAAKAVLTLR